MLIRVPKNTRFAWMIALLFPLSGIGCATHGTDSATAPMDESCLEWTARSDEERFSVVAAALDQQIGGPAASNLASCLWLVSEQIANQSAASCEREGGDFETAMGRAFQSAVNYCEDR